MPAALTIHYAHAAAALTAATGAALIVSPAGGSPVDFLGALLITLTAMTVLTGRIIAAIRETNREADAAFTAGFEMGMDKGYTDGRRSKMSPVANLENRRATHGLVSARGD
jgi:hypothetical protein